MSTPSNIVLIGLMGSGKSTVGRLVAHKSGLEFIDLDEYLEKKIGKSIPVIFEEFGEPYFREIETQVIGEAAAMKGKVLSCGGGVVERGANMEALKRNGMVVYLHASSTQLYQRLSKSHERPLLKVQDPKGRLEELYRRRSPLYEKYADLQIETGGKSPLSVAEEIMKKLKGEFFEKG